MIVKNQKKSVEYLLEKFFEFYSEGLDFDNKDHFINISDDKEILQSRNSLVENSEIFANFFDLEAEKMKKLFKSTYIVRDPFNDTYNPARTISGVLNTFFIEKCEDALERLDNGEFII